MNRKVACFTLDLEPDHGDPQRRVRLLEEEVFRERYIAIVRAHGLKVTVFVVTSLLERYGPALRALSEQIPLEFAVHSHSHDPHNACGRDEIERSSQALKEFSGQAPLGYRAPIGRITREGLGHLMDLGFAYDASLYPSVRPGEYGYANLHMPITPFRVTRAQEDIIEFPFTSLPGIRLVFALSYAKLLGWGMYSALMRLFPPPDVVVALAHPHDFYFHLLADGTQGLERLALLRNAHRGFEYFEKMISALQRQGYEFHFMSELYAQMRARADLPEMTLAEWR